MAVYYTKPVLTQEIVMKMMEAAGTKAAELGIKVNIAIMDHGANLKSFLRMDDAPLMSSAIAQNKAYTAAAFGRSTSEWYASIKDKPELLHGLVHTDRLVIFGGGLPIYIHDDLVGGIGVSGGSAQQDTACAEAALEEVRQHLQEDDRECSP